MQREQLVVRHMRDLVATEPSLRREAMALSAGGPPARALVEANSDALGEAALQERLQAMAVAVATTLASMEVLPAQPAGGYRRIGVRVTLSAPWPAFVGLLHAVEHSAPRMLVGDLTLAGMPLAVRGTDLPLDIVMTVYAFRASTAAAQ